MDGRTGIMKFIDAFHNFAKMLKNESERILTWSKIT
jgi:hypothetical protein